MALVIKDASTQNQILKTTLDGGAHVTHHRVDSSVLPTGAATEASSAAIVAQLADPVMPSGAATDANLALVVAATQAIQSAIALLAKKSDAQPTVMAYDPLNPHEVTVSAEYTDVSDPIVNVVLDAVNAKSYYIDLVDVNNSSGVDSYFNILVGSGGATLYAAYVLGGTSVAKSIPGLIKVPSGEAVSVVAGTTGTTYKVNLGWYNY